MFSILFQGMIVHYVNGTNIQYFPRSPFVLNYELNQIWIGYYDGNRLDYTLASIEFYLKSLTEPQINDAMKLPSNYIYLHMANKII